MSKIVRCAAVIALLFVLVTVPAYANDDGLPIALSGESARIVKNVDVSQVPCRVRYTQEENSDFEISIMKDQRIDSLFSRYDNNTDAGVILDAGVYNFLVETDKSWTLVIEPILYTEELSFSANHSLVTDIFTIDEPTIVNISAQFVKLGTYSTSMSIYIYTNTSNGWKSQLVLNEMHNQDTDLSTNHIIKVVGKTDCFFVIRASSGKVDWTISY